MLSEPRVTQIALMGYDAPRRFVPMVVCIGDCAFCLNRGLRRLRRWAVMRRAVLSRSLSVSGIARFV